MENEELIKEIREKIKNNPKYVNPMNKGFQEDINKYGFKNGYEYTTWMQNNGILKNSTKFDGKYYDNLAISRGFKNCREYRALSRGYKDYKEYYRHLLHERGIYFPMSDNIECPMNLGVHVAERKYARNILPILVGNIIEEMSPNNPGFDFICIGNQKIDVKARRLIDNKWTFPIRYNNIADKFLCIGFNNSEDEKNLKPIIILLINRDEIMRKQEKGNKYIMDKFYKRESFGITNRPEILSQYYKYNKINNEDIKKIIEEII